MNLNNDILDEINQALQENTNAYIDIRNHARNGRKSTTTVEGLPKNVELKPLLSIWKKEFACNGSIQKSENGEDIIQLTGNKKEEVKNYLIKKDICNEKMIRIH